MARWEQRSHGADVGVRGFGIFVEEAFEQAALALSAVVGDISTVTARENVEVHCDAPDLELLLVSWLSAIIYESEHERPVGNDHGYMWRLSTYWRVEEKDGGVYVQNESVALSRTVPAILAWLVNPLVKSIPRNILLHLFADTRTAVLKAEVSSKQEDHCLSIEALAECSQGSK